MNGNEENTLTVPPTSSETATPIKSPRKVSIAADAKNLASEDGSSTSKSFVANLMRRRSTFKGLAQSITNAISMRRMTKTSVDIPQKPKVKMENTFKMNPDDGKNFFPARVKQVVYELLESTLEKETYDANTAGKLTEKLTEQIKRRVKLLKFDRYKIVCSVLLVPYSEQGMEASSRCLWDEKVDNFACVNYKNKSLFVVATVYGIYFE